MTSFPIDQIKDDILKSLFDKDILVINASPGSGKTTRVPLFLIEHFKKRIYILEPRRLAAKLAAHFVSKSLGEKLGQRVGHIFKYETIVSQSTQIFFVTEGTFLRILNDPKNLAATDIIILDEFHERHITTDMALSYILYLKKQFPHLKIIIMSATIDSEKLNLILGESANFLVQNQKKHSIKIHHLENSTLILKDSLEKKVLNTIEKALEESIGHILVFLPGMYEINKCFELISKTYDIEILILHGDLGGIEIDESFEDLTKRKIILSTNIAESSVTIPGVRVVIDSGLHRTNNINHLTRMTQIELKKISQSSATQRAHRSNREDHGVVYRLYPELDFLQRNKFEVPEINRSDLSDLVIKTHSILKAKINDLLFIDPLPTDEIYNAYEYLQNISLIKNNLLTNEGHFIGKTPYSPRIGKILNEASKYNSETFDEVVSFLADWLENKNQSRFKRLAKEYFNPNKTEVSCDLEKIFLSGFIDQIAKTKNETSHELIHQNGESYFLANDLRAHFDHKHPLWIILDLNNKNEISKILPIEEDWLYELDFFPIEERFSFDYDEENNLLKAEEITAIKAIVLDRKRMTLKVLNKEAKKFLSNILSKIFTKRLENNYFKRLNYLEKLSTKKLADFDLTLWITNQLEYFENGNKEWINLQLPTLLFSLLEYLELDSIDLDSELPLTISLHDKRKIEINYDITNGPSIEAYIQDFYGLETVPHILNKSIPITIHLIGPHKRALQVTQDLKSFWNKAYKEMYAELKREYPRHYWPIEPEKSKPILLLRNVT